jgi:hypothetical protein
MKSLNHLFFLSLSVVVTVAMPNSVQANIFQVLFGFPLPPESQRAKSGVRYLELNPTYPSSGPHGAPRGALNAFAWQTVGMNPNPSPTNCFNYEQRMVYWPPQGSYYVLEKRAVPCRPQQIAELEEAQRNSITERQKSCEQHINQTTRSYIEKYADDLASDICPNWAQTNNWPSDLPRRIESYKSILNNEKEAQRKWRVAEDARLKGEFDRRMNIARNRGIAINSQGSSRHFLYTTNERNDYRVFEKIVPIESLRAGRTVSGSNYVDLNVRSLVDTEYDSEVRVRIFCSQAQHGGIRGDGTLYAVGIKHTISVEMGIWACRRFGYYHPPGS